MGTQAAVGIDPGLFLVIKPDPPGAVMPRGTNKKVSPVPQPCVIEMVGNL